MKRFFLILLPFLIFSHSCIAQDLSILEHHRYNASNAAYHAVINYIEKQPDQIALNSIIEVNGIVHPRDTYGYFRYINDGGEDTKCLFQHLGGIMVVSKKDFDEMLKLPDTTQVEIAICLQSPDYGDWGGCYDQVMVKGSFNVGQLSPTYTTFSPCFHFIITTIGQEIFKIQFISWKIQTCYYSSDSCPLTTKQRKRLDKKEQKIYKRANQLDFERELW